MRLDEALERFPTKAALADALGVTRQAITSWKEGEIPERHALRLKYEVWPAMDAGKPFSRSDVVAAWMEGLVDD